MQQQLFLSHRFYFKTPEHIMRCVYVRIYRFRNYSICTYSFRILQYMYKQFSYTTVYVHIVFVYYSICTYSFRILQYMYVQFSYTTVYGSAHITEYTRILGDVAEEKTCTKIYINIPKVDIQKKMNRYTATNL